VRKAPVVAAQTEQAIETQFTLSDQWIRCLFTALCRRCGLEAYPYGRQVQRGLVADRNAAANVSGKSLRRVTKITVRGF
jgi:hypothetical protein